MATKNAKNLRGDIAALTNLLSRKKNKPVAEDADGENNHDESPRSPGEPTALGDIGTDLAQAGARSEMAPKGGTDIAKAGARSEMGSKLGARSEMRPAAAGGPGGADLSAMSEGGGGLGGKVGAGKRTFDAECTVEFVEVELVRAEGSPNLWVVTHNGVRKEMMRMFVALEGLVRRGSFLTEAELRLFFKWFYHFLEFLHNVHDVKEKVLRSWMSSALAIPDKVLDNEVHLLLNMNVFNHMEEKLDRLKPHEIALKLATGLDDFGRRLLASFEKEESAVAAAGHLSEELAAQLKAIEAKYWKAMSSTKIPPSTLPRCIQWMPKRTRLAWERKHLSVKGLMTTNLRMVKIQQKYSLAPLYPPKSELVDEDDEDENEVDDDEDGVGDNKLVGESETHEEGSAEGQEEKEEKEKGSGGVGVLKKISIKNKEKRAEKKAARLEKKSDQVAA